MTQEYFEAMKADLKEVYKADLCQDSLDAINAASNLQEFVNVVHTFSAFLRYKNIPKIDWVRKWFKGHIEEAKECGAYIDIVDHVENPKDRQIILYGDSKVTAIFSEPHVFNVTCQDESELRLVTVGINMVKIRLKDKSRVNSIYQDRNSHVRIRKI